MANLLYNGVSLPAKPPAAAGYGVEVIVNVLPAGQSIYGGSPYLFVQGSRLLWQNGKCYVGGIYAVYRLSGDAWVWHYGSGTVSTQDIVAANYFDALWTNTNIPTADGAGIYLAATEPVDPDAPEEPDEPEEPPEEPEEPTVTTAQLRRAFSKGFILGMQVRGMLKRKVVEEPVGNYIVFESDESFYISVVSWTPPYWDGTMYCSTDAETWNTWDGAKVTSAEDKGKHRIYMRGTGNTHIAGASVNWYITGNNISCNGNIENLLDFEIVAKGEHPVMADDCFAYMFNNCTSLTKAPELPATTLAPGCYSDMFKGCSALTKAPELPATTLANSCYAWMFNNCTSLTKAPELPATTLAPSCYSFMFSSCTELTTAPKLPATTMVTRGYYWMFHGCAALTTLPALPAVVLETECYSNMFSGCNGIKLSATKTDVCNTEYRIPTSGGGTTATDSLDGMFRETGGTFTGTPEINKTYYTSNELI